VMKPLVCVEIKTDVMCKTEQFLSTKIFILVQISSEGVV
jgi:hypothetical protein